MGAVVSSFQAILLLFCLLAGFVLMWRIPSFTHDKEAPVKAEVFPQVSVIIPARNEQERIAPLLRSLQRQTLSPHEILVIDDHSVDDTAAVARALGATVIPGQALPEGWTGKTWACWQGAEHATGGTLVFLDADVRLEEPDGLACLAETHEQQRGLLTAQPYHLTIRAYETLSAVFNIVLMAGLNAFTPWGEALAPSGAFGPCVLCNSEDYARTGGHGHAAVRGTVLESIPLAGIFLAHDLPVRCYGGRGAVWFRMYPGGLRELVEGWSKGFGSGALALRLAFLFLLVAWISGAFGAFVTLIGSLASAGMPGIGIHATIYGLYALQLWWMLRRLGRFQWWAAALFPVPFCFFALIMLRSFLLIHLLGRVEWRGRSVPTRRRGDGP
jgi:4,4'-diaponeurosporenoate glycosyltransferase